MIIRLLIPFIAFQLLRQRTSPLGLDALKNAEGFSATPYQDEAGHWTIGFGHKILPGEQFTQITYEQAVIILKKDLQIAENAVRQLVKVPLSRGQYDALVLFVFNVGVNAFESSTLLKKLNNSDYIGAANELKSWRFITDRDTGEKVVSIGLARRRNYEYQLFTSA